MSRRKHRRVTRKQRLKSIAKSSILVWLKAVSLLVNTIYVIYKLVSSNKPKGGKE